MTYIPELPDGWSLHAFKTVGSTSDIAKEMATEGAAEGSVIWAQQQTAGRGRQGNEWVSPPGNLYMSCILRPDMKVQDAGQFSFLVAVSLANVLSNLGISENEITLKWPNDILLRGKKLAGILLESDINSSGRTNWVILGVGVNLEQAPDDAIALNEVIEVEPSRFLSALCAEIKKQIILWQAQGFAPIRTSWIKQAAGLQQTITAHLQNEELQGVFLGLAEDGALRLGLKDGTERSITSGEVFF